MAQVGFNDPTTDTWRYWEKHVNTSYITLVDVTQMLISLKDCSNVSVRQEL